jgi:hypothetical protein
MDTSGWNPSRELAEMSDRVTRVFPRISRRRKGNEAMTVADRNTSVDISEISAEHLTKAEILEVKKEDLRVTLDMACHDLPGP